MSLFLVAPSRIFCCRRLVADGQFGRRLLRRRLFYAHQPEVCFALGDETDEAADLRIYRFAKLAAAENAVVTQTPGKQMLALVGRDVPAKHLRGFGLAI